MSLTNPPIYTSWRNLERGQHMGTTGDFRDVHMTNAEAIQALQREVARLKAAQPDPVETAETVNFDLTHALPGWHLAPSYANEVTVEFDGAEGGAVWVHDSETDESIAIRGPVAMRELARMLNAFADGYTGPLEGAQ